MKLSLDPLQYFWPRDTHAGLLPRSRDVAGGRRLPRRNRVQQAPRTAHPPTGLRWPRNCAAAGKEVVLSSPGADRGRIRARRGRSAGRRTAASCSRPTTCRGAAVRGTRPALRRRTDAQHLQPPRAGDAGRGWPACAGCRASNRARPAARATCWRRSSADGGAMPELEVIAWGRLPLAYSARCFTARALDVAKDAVRLPLHRLSRTACRWPPARAARSCASTASRYSGEEVTDLGPELPALRALGVDMPAPVSAGRKAWREVVRALRPRPSRRRRRQPARPAQRLLARRTGHAGRRRLSPLRRR